MVLVNTDFITGQNLQTLRLITGQSLHFDFALAKRNAERNLIEEAKEMGADGIINIRYMWHNDRRDDFGVIVSGTAVKFVEEKECGSSTAEGFGPRHVSVKLVD